MNQILGSFLIEAGLLKPQEWEMIEAKIDSFEKPDCNLFTDETSIKISLKSPLPSNIISKIYTIGESKKFTFCFKLLDPKVLDEELFLNYANAFAKTSSQRAIFDLNYSFRATIKGNLITIFGDQDGLITRLKKQEEELKKFLFTFTAINFEFGYKPAKEWNDLINFRSSASTLVIDDLAKIDSFNNEYIIEAKIFKVLRKQGLDKITGLLVTDYKNAIQCDFNLQILRSDAIDFVPEVNDWVKIKCRLKQPEAPRYASEGANLRLNLERDTYVDILAIKKIDEPERFKRVDKASQKRIEIIMHTNLSAFDGLNSPSEIIQCAKNWGWKYVCVTDTNCMQAFPEFANLAKDDLQVIYGAELNVVPDFLPIVENANSVNFDEKEYVVFDLETTSLIPAFGEIIEFGAIKYKGDRKIDHLSFLIKSVDEIPLDTVELTGIKDEDLQRDGIEVKQALKKIVDFIGKATLVAHNGIYFDFPFLNASLEKYGFKRLKNEVVDTLRLSWAINPNETSHNLGKMSRRFGVDYIESEAHRALADVEFLSKIWLKLLGIFKDDKITNSIQLNQKYANFRFWPTNRCFFPTFVYAKNQKGLKLLYALLSEMLSGKRYRENSHLPADDPHFSVKSPRISMADLTENREDLVIVNNPIEGDLINAAMLGDDEMLGKLMKVYDYIAIAPPEAYEHKIKNKYLTKENYQTVIKKIIELASKRKKKCVATSDAYYLEKWQKEFHRVLVYTKAIGGKRHRFYDYRKKNKDGTEEFRIQHIPDLHLFTTDEMLESFAFLGDQKLIEKIVITNSQKFADSFKKVEPIPKTKFSFQNPEYEKSLVELTWKNAKLKYGEKLHPIILERIEHELNSIIKNGYSTVYWISHLLVEESEKNRFPVGSRGSVGSSIVALLLGISEINPLASHYCCNQCHYVEFTPQYEDGYDLEKINCPKCGSSDYIGDGHNIPFETFMGLHGEKVPDIDLNFSGLYQAKAHEFVREQFGATHTLRAGTIATIAEKTAMGYVRTYFDEIRENNISNSKILWYAKNITGVKRTTGQHPGGIIIFPKEKSVLDFTPINYPADDVDSNWCTTHFSFEYLHDILLKLDILGHDDPSMIKKLEEDTYTISQQSSRYSKVAYRRAKEIPHKDDDVLELFRDLRTLKLTPNDLLKTEVTGAIGLPEFGTNFVRKILIDTQPTHFADLVRISGLSHGTNVWRNNAEKLIKLPGQKVKFSDVIACRDDIMNYLTRIGMPPDRAFAIMENIRKGKMLTSQEADLMRKHNVPEWYIESCRQIKYLFPKAHAAAYVLMAWRIAWYKLYWPLAYYAAQFTYKIIESDIENLCSETLNESRKNVLTEYSKIKNKEVKWSKQKEEELINTYEVAFEMFARGIRMLPISLSKSAASEYIVDLKNNGLIPPFKAIPGLGQIAAESIVIEREKQPFRSTDDFNERTKVTRTNFKKLEDLGVFKGMDKESSKTLNLFSKRPVRS